MWTDLFISCGQIPRNRIDRSKGKCMFNFIIIKLFSKVVGAFFVPATVDESSGSSLSAPMVLLVKRVLPFLLVCSESQLSF